MSASFREVENEAERKWRKFDRRRRCHLCSQPFLPRLPHNSLFRSSDNRPGHLSQIRPALRALPSPSTSLCFETVCNIIPRFTHIKVSIALCPMGQTHDATHLAQARVTASMHVMPGSVRRPHFYFRSPPSRLTLGVP